jgi:hypothetical protein
LVIPELEEQEKDSEDGEAHYESTSNEIKGILKFTKESDKYGGKKFYVHLKQQRLYFYKRTQRFSEPYFELSLRYVIPRHFSSDSECTFRLITLTKMYVLETHSKGTCNAWLSHIQHSIEKPREGVVGM